jgi:AcrR family transcriptional regulator
VRRGVAADADRLRGELLSAALALFIEGGLEAVTMRAVATQVGVSAMTPYRYYEDKGHLLRGIWQHVLGAAWNEVLGAAQGLPDVRDRIRAQVNAFIDYWEANPQHYRLVYMTEQTTRSSENDALVDLPIYVDVLESSLEASRQLAAQVGGDPSHAKLASDIRFMMVSGYLHARLVNRRYPWGPVDVLRPTFVELVIEAMASCLRDGPREAPQRRRVRKAQKS